MLSKLRLFFFFCFFLFMLEGGARLFISIKPVYHRIIESNDCDTTWRWGWIERHNKDTVIYYNFDRYDLAKGWALKPNVSNMACFEKKTVNSNSKGIRGKIEYAYGKNNKLRILILGDSYTFGDEVSDDETYPYYLQQLLPNAEVINFGVHGYGHDQMLVYLKEEGIKYKPDIIILGFISQDADRNMLKFRDYAKPKFELVNNELKLCNSPVPPPDIFLKEEIWRPKIIDLADLLHYKILIKSGIYAARREKLTNAILKEITITAKSIGATPVFVYLEDIRSKEPSNGMDPEEQYFFDTCKSINTDCVFLISHLQSAGRQRIRREKDGHFSPETNQIIALDIKEYLTKSGRLGERAHSSR